MTQFQLFYMQSLSKKSFWSFKTVIFSIMVLKMEIILKMTPQSGLELPLVEPSYGNL